MKKIQKGFNNKTVLIAIIAILVVARLFFFWLSKPRYGGQGRMSNKQKEQMYTLIDSLENDNKASQKIYVDSLTSKLKEQKDSVISKGISERSDADAEYAKEVVKTYDKFIRDPEIKKYLDEMYSIALERSEGDLEYAQKMMRDILGKDVGIKELDRYLKTVEVKQLPTGSYEIKFKK